MLEPLAPLNAARRAIALSRHPLELTEVADAGLQARIAGPPVFAGVYTPVIARKAPDEHPAVRSPRSGLGVEAPESDAQMLRTPRSLAP